METQSHLEISQLLNYITKDELEQVTEKTEEIARMLSGLKKTLDS